MKNRKLLPFLKWPGGKRWLTSKYCDCFPKQYNQYYEPFLGGGAIFFFLQPTHATLSDVNEKLIVLYKVIRDNCSELAKSMRMHQKSHCKEYYYKTRCAYFDDPVQSASQFLYLNRMCYNGMYRVNKAGQFNVPIGTKQNCIYDIDQFTAYSALLKGVELEVADFSVIVNRARESDLVFIDPPYTIALNQNSFIKYNDRLFTWDDQDRLLKALCTARDRGAYVMGTNANYDMLKTMYLAHGFHVKVVERFSVISSKADKRKRQEELLITSYPVDNINVPEVS